VGGIALEGGMLELASRSGRPTLGLLCRRQRGARGMPVASTGAGVGGGRGGGLLRVDYNEQVGS
jgi:hypothetical protein